MSRHPTTFRQKIVLGAAGILAAFLILELVLRLGGLFFLVRRDLRNIRPSSPGRAVTILCIGESTTAYGGDDSYPIQLRDELGQRLPEIEFSMVNEGVPGITTEIILSRMESLLEKHDPDIIITMMGINDKLYGEGRMVAWESNVFERAFSAIERFRTVKLLKWAIAGAGNRGRFQDDDPRTAESTDVDKPFLGLELGYGTQGKGYKKNSDDLSKESIFIKQGLAFRDKRDPDKAIRMFKQAIAINPKNEWAHLELGLCYFFMRRYDSAQNFYEQAIALNPANEEGYYRLAFVHLARDDDARAIEMFEKTLELDPKRVHAYLELARRYQVRNDDKGLERIYRRAIVVAPADDWGYRGLATLYEKLGKSELAGQYRDQADELAQRHYNSFTYENYQGVAELLQKKGIVHVVMQYPMRSVEPLKVMLKDFKDIHFVDNEESFKKAVRKKGYGGVFTDNFAGDFGHCTPLGYGLMAKNIADVIEKKWGQATFFTF